MPNDNKLLDIASWETRYKNGLQAMGARAHQKAVEYLTDSLRIAEELELAEPLMHSMLALGDAYKIAGEFDIAQDVYKKIISRASGNTELRVFSAIAQGSIGMVLMGQNDVKGALMSLENAVAAIKRLREHRLPEFVPIFIGLAGVYIEVQDFEKADKTCRYALEYAREVLGPHDVSTVTVMNLCAMCAELLGKPRRAETLRCQMRAILEELEGIGPDQLGIAKAMPGMIQKREVEKEPITEIKRSKSNVIPFRKDKTEKLDSKEIALEKAEAIVEQAWNQPERRREKLAKEALEISPDCAQAYLLLAESARRTEKRIALLRKAVAAANRTLETDWQTKYEGHCWQVPENRTVLRAMAMLATELQLNDELEEALELYRRLMQLTPSDNQGIRYHLAQCLFEAHRDTELEKLLKDYSDDPSAALLYTNSLHLFRKEGASTRANAALLKAFEANPFVPLFLSELVELPENKSGRIGVGDESEAAAYIEDYCYLWGDTDGAEVWMAEQLEPGMRRVFPDKQMVDAVLVELRLE